MYDYYHTNEFGAWYIPFLRNGMRTLIPRPTHIEFSNNNASKMHVTLILPPEPTAGETYWEVRRVEEV